MRRTYEELNKKFWPANRATGGQRAQALADIARSALAFAGLLDFLVPQQVKPAIKAYEAVVPAGLRYTNEQWLHNKDQAMSAILGNGPQDEKDLALVLHKRNPKSHAPGALWRWTLPEEAYEGEPEWFEKARAARAEVRAHVKANLADIMKTLVEVDAKNAGVVLMDDDELIEYEKVVPKVKDKKPADDEAEDSGDAAKENAGAARGSKSAAAKPAKAQKPPKKRAASDCDSDDAEFELEAPPAKRTKPAKVVKVADIKKEEDDQDFFNAVKAVRRAFKKENSNRYDLTRGLVLKLGLLEPSPEAFEQRKIIGKFVKDLAGGETTSLAEQFFEVLRDQARLKGITVPAVEFYAAPAAEESDHAAEEPEAAAA